MFLKLAKAMPKNLYSTRSRQNAIIRIQKRKISFIPFFKLIIRMTPIILPFVMSALQSIKKTERGRIYFKKIPPFMRTFIESLLESSNKNFNQQKGDFNFNQRGYYRGQSENFFREDEYEYSRPSKETKIVNDYYAVLGLPKSATAAEIKNSYKEKVKV